MTAFGSGQATGAGYSVSVEMKTINSRSLDLVVRLPRARGDHDLEKEVRGMLSRSFRRGRIEVFIQLEATEPARTAPRIDTALASRHWSSLRELHSLLPGCPPPTLGDLLRCPDLFDTPDEARDREPLRRLVSKALEEVVGRVKDMRAEEGRALAGDLLERLELLRRDLGEIEERRETVLQEYAARFRRRMEELLEEAGVTADEGRILQEVAVWTDKSDITEEIVRIRSHLDQMENGLLRESPVEGRTLDFLGQELHREVNTVGSKTGDLEIARRVVRMKTEIGKLKEQIQNIE